MPMSVSPFEKCAFSRGFVRIGSSHCINAARSEDLYLSAMKRCVIAWFSFAGYTGNSYGFAAMESLVRQNHSLADPVSSYSRCAPMIDMSDTWLWNVRDRPTHRNQGRSGILASFCFPALRGTAKVPCCIRYKPGIRYSSATEKPLNTSTKSETPMRNAGGHSNFPNAIGRQSLRNTNLRSRCLMRRKTHLNGTGSTAFPSDEGFWCRCELYEQQIWIVNRKNRFISVFW